MCGRYAFSHSVDDYQALFRVANPQEFATEGRYNIAPSQPITIVFRNREGLRNAGKARWGLIPGWVKNPSEWKASTFNARSEDAAVKPTYRRPFRRGRVLVPASGFYEWKRVDETKVPYHVRAKDGSPLAFAGLMDVCRNQESGERLVSCAIMTTRATGELQELHSRMPVLVRQSEFAAWLSSEDAGEALDLVLAGGAQQDLDIYRVSTAVNSTRDDRPEFTAPAA